MMVRAAVEAIPLNGINKDGVNAQEVSAGRAVQERLTVPV